MLYLNTKDMASLINRKDLQNKTSKSVTDLEVFYKINEQLSKTGTTYSFRYLGKNT